MTERDPLRDRFEAFRERTTVTAVPPPVEEIPRRLHRTRARRAVVAVAAVAVLASLLTWPSLHRESRGPNPATSALRPSGPSATAKTAASCGVSERGLPVLPNGQEGHLTYNDTLTSVVPEPADLFTLCPSARVPFVHVMYRWDVTRKQYVVQQSIPAALTKVQWAASAYGNVETGDCGGADVFIATSHAAPSALPRPVQDSADPVSALMTFLQPEGAPLPISTQVYSYEALMARPACVGEPSTPSSARSR